MIGCQGGLLLQHDKAGVAEKYVKVLQDLYKDIETMVRCAAGITYRLKVHQDNR